MDGPSTDPVSEKGLFVSCAQARPSTGPFTDPVSEKGLFVSCAQARPSTGLFTDPVSEKGLFVSCAQARPSTEPLPRYSVQGAHGVPRCSYIPSGFRFAQ